MPNELEPVINQISKLLPDVISITENSLPKSITSMEIELLASTDLSKSIEILQRMHDKRNNINCFLKDDTLIRDGRNANDPPIPTVEAYIIQYLNHVRGAISIIDDQELKSELENTALEKVKELIKINKIDKAQSMVKKANSKLATKLLKNGVKNPVRKIRLAKDFANFQDNHYNMVTISEHKGTPIVETDIKQSKLTDSQKRMFQTLQDLPTSDSKKRLKVDIKGENMDWFNKLHRWEQNLVIKNSSKILSETYVIPTQLRNILPLLRNCYNKNTSIIKNDREVIHLLGTRHSGSISSATKGDNVLHTMENIKQVRLNNPGSSIHLNALLSPINIFDADSEDHRLTGEAIKMMAGVKRTTLPFNFLRKYFRGGVDLDGTEYIMQEVSDQIKKSKYPEQLQTFSEFILDLKSDKFKKAQEEVNNIKDPNLKRSLNCALEVASDLIKAKKVGIFSKDIENINSSISINMKLLSNYAKMGYLGEELKSMPIMISYCKSGKDRTQMIELGATLKALKNYFQLESSEDIKELTKNVLKAQHSQTIAGTQGGTLGCYGIKGTTTMDGNKTLFADLLNYISPESADYNKFKINKLAYAKAKIAKQLTKYYKKLEPQVGKISISSAPTGTKPLRTKAITK